MAKRINRQKLFLDLLEGKIETKTISVYTDDYYGDAKNNYREEKEFSRPDDLMYWFDLITGGRIWEGEKGLFNGNYASFYTFELKEVTPKTQTIQDKFLIEVFKDCKKTIEYIDSNDISRAFYILALGWFDEDLRDMYIINHSFSRQDNAGYIDSMIEKYSFLNTEKFHNMLSELSIDEQIELFKKYSMKSEYFDRIKNKKEVETIELIENNIISFPVVEKIKIKTEIKENNFFNSQLDIFGGETNIKKAVKQLSMF